MANKDQTLFTDDGSSVPASLVRPTAGNAKLHAVLDAEQCRGVKDNIQEGPFSTINVFSSVFTCALRAL